MPAVAGEANIAPLMLEGPGTQTTPADEPADEAERSSEIYGSLGVAFTMRF